jgi:energy-coupling factor transport system ATP-binding protein
MPLMPLLIKTENLTYVYGRGTPWEVKALSEVSLDVSEGEVVGIIGPAGCGKSTLVQHLGGLIKPTSGKVYFRGADMSKGGGSLRALRREIGLVFQYAEQGLFEETVFRDVAFGARSLGLPEEEVEGRVRESLSLVGLDLELYRDRSPFGLSGGEARRVAIAGVLAMRPSLLILDEPTVGLDPGGRRIISGKIKELHDLKMATIVFVSHSMEEVASFADRVVVMNRGGVAMAGTPREVFSRAAELKGMGLGLPKVAELMGRLRERYPLLRADVLTVDEARDEIMRAIKGVRLAR